MEKERRESLVYVVQVQVAWKLGRTCSPGGCGSRLMG